jgi:transposase
MKKIVFLLFIAIATTAAAQNNDYLVTPNAIGPLKLGTKKTTLEKIIGKKITLKYLLTEDGWQDTVKTKYKNTDITLYLQRNYVDSAVYDIVLSGMMVNNPLYKTRAGIGIGDDKLKVINAYEFNSISLWPEFEDEEYTRRSKTKSVITVYFDKEGNSLTFYLLNKKITSIEVSYAEEGD